MIGILKQSINDIVLAFSLLSTFTILVIDLEVSSQRVDVLKTTSSRLKCALADAEAPLMAAGLISKPLIHWDSHSQPSLEFKNVSVCVCVCVPKHERGSE